MLAPAPHATRCPCGRPIQADEYVAVIDGDTLCEVCTAPEPDDDYSYAFDCT